MEELDRDILLRVLLSLIRYLAPALALLLLLRCGMSILRFRRQPEELARFVADSGEIFPVFRWENVIGRSRFSDVVCKDPSVSRTHSILLRGDDGSWQIRVLRSGGKCSVNGMPMAWAALRDGDTLTVGNCNLHFFTEVEGNGATQCPRGFPLGNVLLLTALQGLCILRFRLAGDMGSAVVGQLGLIFLEWVMFTVNLLCRCRNFEPETLVFLLCTMGMAVVGTVAPGEVTRQLLAMGLGVGTFYAVGWTLGDLGRAKRMRYTAAVAGVVLLIVVLLFGREYYGARNWLVIGGLSVQPSEIVKICYVYVGASTLDRLLEKRNRLLFAAYTIALCGLLALMNDFGTALVFFSAFLLIAYLRSGSIGTIALSCAGLLFAGIIGLKIAPHALQRLTAWRHIWEDPLNTGFQQTRALMCIASGGFWGLGVGQGKMKTLFAADSDMVFATVCEEWGLGMALILVLCVMALALFVLRKAVISPSSFYTIGGCAAAGMLLVQTVLNVLGTVDVLPLTGITFPFVSNGGSSMVCVWGLLGFIKGMEPRRKIGQKGRLEDA